MLSALNVLRILDHNQECDCSRRSCKIPRFVRDAVYDLLGARDLNDGSGYKYPMRVDVFRTFRFADDGMDSTLLLGNVSPLRVVDGTCKPSLATSPPGIWPAGRA